MEVFLEEQFRLLAEVQDIDIKINKLRENITRSPKKIEKLEAEHNALGKKIEFEQIKIDELEKERATHELDLQESDARAAKSKENLMSIKSNKEYKASLKETAAIEKANRELEDVILSSMGKSDKANSALAEIKQELSVRKDEFEKEKKRIEKDARRDEKELAAVLCQRNKMIEKVDRDLKRKYDQTQKRLGTLAVARVENGVCHGCHMNIPPQMYNEIQRLDSVRLCPNCQRIMYYNKEE